MRDRSGRAALGGVFTRGDGNGWIQYSVRGKQVRETLGFKILCPADERKAEKKLRKRLGEVEAGIYRSASRLSYESVRDSLLARLRGEPTQITAQQRRKAIPR